MLTELTDVSRILLICGPVTNPYHTPKDTRYDLGNEKTGWVMKW